MGLEANLTFGGRDGHKSRKVCLKTSLTRKVGGKKKGGEKKEGKVLGAEGKMG